MKVEAVNTTSPFYEKLQAFVQKHGLVFNAATWLTNYRNEAIVQCVVLNNNNDVIGCFIYYRFKKGWFNFIITPPYSPNIDLFYINPAESVVGKNSFHKDLSTAIAAYFDALNADYINLNLPDFVVDTQPFIWKGYTSKTRYSYLVDLSRSKEELWNNLSSEKRKSVNKAVKDNLEIAASTDYTLIHSLIIKSLERNEVAKNNAILHKILFSFASPDNSFCFVASNNGKPIGATFCVIDKTRNRAIYLFGGFDAENKHHGAHVSCMWQSILKTKEAGLGYFDFEGSMNPDIERYFREFGGEITQYPCIEKIKPLLNVVLKIGKHNPL